MHRWPQSPHPTSEVGALERGPAGVTHSPLSSSLLPSIANFITVLMAWLRPASCSPVLSWFSFCSASVALLSNMLRGRPFPSLTSAPLTEEPGQPGYNLYSGGCAEMPRRKGWEGFPEELRPKGQGVWAVENHRRLFVLHLGERTRGCSLPVPWAARKQ